MFSMSKIGATLRAERARARMNQAELAKASGVSEGTIARLEQGRGGLPGVDVLNDLARALAVDVRIFADEVTP